MKVSRLLVLAVALSTVLAFTLNWVSINYGPVAGIGVFALLTGLSMISSPLLGRRMGAVVAISDIYNPVTFGRRIQQAQLELNRFLRSGIAVSDPLIANQISQGGNTGEVSNLAKLATGEPGYSTDNPASSSTPANISSELQKFRLAARNKSWSTMDLARELALIDPVGGITGRIGSYWATDDEQRLISSLLGVLADNIANDSSDMVIDVATDDAAAVTDNERISSTRTIDALQTMGDHKSSLTAMAMHSAIHTRLQKQNLISYIRDADNNIMFETYMGKQLIIDDSLPAVAGSNRITYTSVLFAPGAVGTANGRVMVPSEMLRVPAAGDGGGQDIIFSRVSNVWHPYGFSFLSTTITSSLYATYAQLKLAGNWNRVHSRKNIPIAFLKTND